MVRLINGYRLQYSSVTVLISHHLILSCADSLQKCASLPREGGAKWDLDPFFLFLSPPQFEIWNLVHFSQVCPPGSQFLQRQRCSSLPCSIRLFTDLNQLWHFDRKALPIFWFDEQQPTPTFIHFFTWRVFGYFSAKVVNKTFFSLQTARGLWNIRNFYFFSLTFWPGCWAVMIVNWTPNNRDVEASPASFLLSLLHLCLCLWDVRRH